MRSDDSTVIRLTANDLENLLKMSPKEQERTLRPIILHLHQMEKVAKEIR